MYFLVCVRTTPPETNFRTFSSKVHQQPPRNNRVKNKLDMEKRSSPLERIWAYQRKYLRVWSICPLDSGLACTLPQLSRPGQPRRTLNNPLIVPPWQAKRVKAVGALGVGFIRKWYTDKQLNMNQLWPLATFFWDIFYSIFSITPHVEELLAACDKTLFSLRTLIRMLRTMIRTLRTVRYHSQHFPTSQHFGCRQIDLLFSGLAGLNKYCWYSVLTTDWAHC